MITEHDLKEAIAECEGQRNPTSNTCLKLAAYYAIKDRMYPEKEAEKPQRSLAPLGYSYANSERSEFRQAVDGLDSETFLDIMDELMSAVRVIIPKLYEGVMRKLTE